jgi:hypothetical protein
MPDGSPAAGSVLPPAPCAVGVGEVPGAVPISGFTNCVSDVSTGVVVPPPAGEVGCDPPVDEVGDDPLFEPPHAANIKLKATPAALIRISFNMMYLVIGKYPVCASRTGFFIYFAGFKSRRWARGWPIGVRFVDMPFRRCVKAEFIERKSKAVLLARNITIPFKFCLRGVTGLWPHRCAAGSTTESSQRQADSRARSRYARQEQNLLSWLDVVAPIEHVHAGKHAGADDALQNATEGSL